MVGTEESPSKAPHDNRPELLQEVVRGAEKFLDGQVNLATSADRRAASMIGVFAAAAAGIAAASIGAYLTNNTTIGPATFIAGMVTAAMFIIGGGLCWLSAKPAGIHLPGTTPAAWKKDLSANTGIDSARQQLADNYQDYIVHNQKLLERCARLYCFGSLFGISAPFVGGIIWMLMLLCRSSH